MDMTIIVGRIGGTSIATITATIAIAAKNSPDGLTQGSGQPLPFFLYDSSLKNKTATGVGTGCRVCQEVTAPGW
jgi:hypothetical protein